MYIFFDTETNGLPKNYKAPATDVDNWPQVIQIAWTIYDEDEKIVREENYLIDVPFDFEMNDKATDIHGFTKDNIIKYGICIESAMKRFAQACGQSSIIIAHNMNFDSNIILCEMERLSLKDEMILFENIHKVCTMEGSKEFVGIKNSFGYKWPTLQELHHKIFDKNFADAHNAMVDIRATAKCYFELKRLNVLQ